MLKLLLVAPGCDGEDVGESRGAYQWARVFSGRHDVTLLTYYKRGHTPPSRQLGGVRCIEWPEPPAVGRAERFNSLLKPGYAPFYLRARRWIRDALACGEQFDIAHQMAPGAMRYPSPLAGMRIPFIMGPVGGGLDSPPGFRREERDVPWYVRLRETDRVRLRWDPLLRRTYEDAGCVVGIAPYARQRLAGVAIRRFEVMSNTGIEALADPVDRTGRTGPVRLLFAGRLIRTKGVQDAIRALALARDLPVRLDVVGDGPDGAACRALAAGLGLDGQVRFHGWLPRTEVDQFYRSADVFLFPSYREPGGNVVVEAMSHGLPAIVSSRGGPANMVDEASGLQVGPVSPEQYARDLAAAIALLVKDPALRWQMGDAARLRVAGIGLWDDRVRRMESIFNTVLTDQENHSHVRK